MKHRKHSTVRAAAALMFLLSSAATVGRAQTPAPAAGKMPEHRHDMPGMPGMTGMMNGPHHVLAMAYRENLITFTRALQQQVTGSKIVDRDMARPAVAEMRRSFDQMQLHHKAQMAMMADQPMADKKAADMTMGGMKMGGTKNGGMKKGGMKMGESSSPPTAATMQAMENHLAALDEQLTALQAEVNASAPDPASILGHTAEILKHCAAMSSKPASAKPHEMK